MKAKTKSFFVQGQKLAKLNPLVSTQPTRQYQFQCTEMHTRHVLERIRSLCLWWQSQKMVSFWPKKKIFTSSHVATKTYDTAFWRKQNGTHNVAAPHNALRYNFEAGGVSGTLYIFAWLLYPTQSLTMAPQSHKRQFWDVFFFGIIVTVNQRISLILTNAQLITRIVTGLVKH